MGTVEVAGQRGSPPLRWAVRVAVAVAVVQAGALALFDGSVLMLVLMGALIGTADNGESWKVLVDLVVGLAIEAGIVGAAFALVVSVRLHPWRACAAATVLESIWMATAGAAFAGATSAGAGTDPSLGVPAKVALLWLAVALIPALIPPFILARRARRTSQRGEVGNEKGPPQAERPSITTS